MPREERVLRAEESSEEVARWSVRINRAPLDRPLPSVSQEGHSASGPEGALKREKVVEQAKRRGEASMSCGKGEAVTGTGMASELCRGREAEGSERLIFWKCGVRSGLVISVRGRRVLAFRRGRSVNVV